jgi:hypothetical protein
MIPESDTIMWDHENNEVFKQAHDEQLLLWLHRSVQFVGHQMCPQILIRNVTGQYGHKYLLQPAVVKVSVLVSKAELSAVIS